MSDEDTVRGSEAESAHTGSEELKSRRRRRRVPSLSQRCTFTDMCVAGISYLENVHGKEIRDLVCKINSKKKIF